MTWVSAELLALAESLNDSVQLPNVKRVYIPEPSVTADKDPDFGLIELDDGSCGLFYAWLGDSQTGISRRFAAAEFIDVQAITLARYISGLDDMARSIGLAAINAMAQHFFARANVVLSNSPNSMGGLDLHPGDRLGMIGNFPSLVRQARACAVPVIVVERKSHLFGEQAGVRISDDPESLSSCNKIICTASTLINDTVDDMLGYCKQAAQVAMIGPSAGFFPDPLFQRGVTVVGGSRVINADEFIASQARGRGLRDCTRRYSLLPATYPGTVHLIRLLG
ncbi:MAG: DUF364 domain-containing protein [Proteobacteria bacterium]|nr:DUF364 domain-containing protein [Pseudomonadota bacterium]